MTTTAVERALHAIAEQHGGNLDPEVVIAAARDPGSPLHTFFTWDQAQAAHERHIDQARTLIRSVRMNVTTRNVTLSVPVYLRDPTKSTHMAGYSSLSRIRSDEDQAREAVITEFRRAADALKRARAVAVALGLPEEQIEQMQQGILGMISVVSEGSESVS